MYFFKIFEKNSIITFFLIVAVLFLCTLTFVYASQNSEITEESVKVPILMYHSVLKNKKSEGVYVVSPELFENDLVYLKKNGYTTVFINDLSDYVRNNKPLPEKPVIITLDDGYYNNYVYVLPLLEKYDMKASIAVVGNFTDMFSQADAHNANYSHMTWDDLSKIEKSGYVEISNHTYDMHKTSGRFGCFIKKSESKDEYKEAFISDIMKMQTALKEKAGIECKIFTYPYGKIYNGSIPLIKEMGFMASLSCHEKINYITKDEECLYLLGRFNRPSGISTENFMRKNGI